MTMHRFGFALTAAALAAFGVSGCATKNYVRNQTAPLIEHTGQLNTESAQNNREIQDVNSRAQAGIQKAQNAADAAQQNAQNAGTEAAAAQTAADNAVHRADSLDSVVMGLDNYKQVAGVTVHFAFNKAALTKDDRAQLDHFAAANLTSAQNYILEVTGGCDSTGPAQYNYDLSQRRADAVVQYLASKYNIAPRRFYLIGIGKAIEVASNKTAQGRAENRRVEVQMLTNNMPAQSSQAASASPSQTAAGNQ
jgi:outer membrane protein OmpA-like peptidoglycan-associated protein